MSQVGRKLKCPICYTIRMKEIILNMNEMKKYHVIKAVAYGKKSKARAGVELGLSRRQINRLLLAFNKNGKAAFAHGNRGKTSNQAIPTHIKTVILTKYENYGAVKPNVVHFCELLAEEENIHFSDTTIRSLLYSAGFLSPKTQRKTKKRLKKQWRERQKHSRNQEENPLLPLAKDFLEEPIKSHPSRARKKYRGELIQMDASQLVWFNNIETHLHVAIDDASGDIVGAYFDTQETLNGYYNVLHQILDNEGIPVRLLSDKRTVFTYQSKVSKKIEEDTFTQFGFACHQLGIDLVTSSIPQAKGRVERLNQTIQSRLPIDLKRMNITTIEQANQYLKRWIKQFNKKFGGKTSQSVFEQSPKPSEINLLLARVAERVIDSGHHIRYQNQFYLPLQSNEALYFMRKTRALVIEAFDGNIYLNIAEHIYDTRQLEEHERYSKEFDDLPEIKKERRKYIPPQSHPWKLASFINHLHKLGKSYEDYVKEQEELAL